MPEKPSALSFEAKMISLPNSHWLEQGCIANALYMVFLKVGFSTIDYTTSNPKADGSIPKKKVIRFKAGADLDKKVK